MFTSSKLGDVVARRILDAPKQDLRLAGDRLSSPRNHVDTLMQLRQAVLEMNESLDAADDLAAVVEASLRFHRQQAALSCNPIDKQGMAQACEAIGRTCDILLTRLQTMHTVLAEAEAMLCANKAHDSAAASAVMQWHVAAIERPSIFIRSA
jgi:DNA-binding FadR family transcriptional regulator